MQLSELFFSELTPILSYSMIFVMMVLMLVISTRLYLNRRKKAYLTMTVSLIFLTIHYALLFYFRSAGIDNSIASYASIMLELVSFVLVNTGIYQLYNPTRSRHYAFISGLIIFGFIVSLLHFYIPTLYTGVNDQIRLLQDIGIELYSFVLIFLCFYLIPPFIGQHIKYQTSLLLYFGQLVAHILNNYVYAGTQLVLSFMEHMMLIAYYFVLFLILFERVVELMQAIYRSSITDGLTGMFNRKFFYNRVNQYVQRQFTVFILFSDIDNFKKLNDTQGHQMGDEVLKQVAQIMKEECEDVGIAGRYGGEEMVILVTDPNVRMEAFAEKIRQRIESETIVTASLGYSKFKSGVTAEQLIKQADEAMYKAKTTGKNKVVKYT
jgi:diguanylate cyclase (GGDEF)-like protein